MLTTMRERLISTKNSLSRLTLYLFIASSGFAMLSWEIIWQIKSTLALGVSAFGTAITLAVIMGGMSMGGFLMGRTLRESPPVRAVRLYGLLELIVGVAGLFLNIAFQVLEKFDTWIYPKIPASVSLIYIFGIVAVLGIPTLCMGATLPVFGLIAKRFQISIAKLYSLNTLGAAIGVLFAALILIPWVGITHTIWIIAAMNIAIGLSAWLLPEKKIFAANEPDTEKFAFQSVSFKETFIVFVTGFATFALEIAWFRSLASTFPNTTDIFAIMLASVLIALGLAAKNVTKLKQKKKSLGTQISLAGILILLVTPLMERFDILFNYPGAIATTNVSALVNLNWLLNPDTFVINQIAILLYAVRMLMIFFMTCFLIIPPMRFLSIAFPWILDNQHSSHQLGKLYAVNTLAGILGAIGAAWFLLPTIGFVKTTWITGILVVIAGVVITSGSLKRIVWTVCGIMALWIAIFFETGIGKTRIQGYFVNLEGKPPKVLDFFEGPDATVSAVQYGDGTRVLLINNTVAAGESGHTYRPSIHYMAWMGHLPMLLESNPKNALVICFGTGQTANALDKENPQSLDVVDVNPHIFKMAPYFKSNEGVLHDPKVKAIVMDGRAYMRRTRKIYDVITLEPMPPVTSGVNALYSREFYELAWKRLGPKGVIAQWLPFHVVAPHYAASIAKTFIDVFPNAILWIDPDSKNGILLGTKDNSVTLATGWPGFARTSIPRDLSQEEVLKNIALDPKSWNNMAHTEK